MAHTFKTFILDAEEDAGTWTPNGGQAATLNSIIDWNFNRSSTVTDGNADGEPFVQGIYTDNIRGTVTINTKDIKQFEDFDIGAYGILVLHGKQRKAGKELDTPEIDWTFGIAVLDSVDATVRHSPDSDGTVTFQIQDNGSGALYATA